MVYSFEFNKYISESSLYIHRGFGLGSWTCIVSEDDALGKKKVFLTIRSKTSYFKGCTTDIVIELQGSRSPNKETLCKIEPNIQVYKGDITQILVIPQDDFCNLIREMGTQTPSPPIFCLSVNIRFAFYDVVRSYTD